jgi:outer membrane protein TolC
MHGRWLSGILLMGLLVGCGAGPEPGHYYTQQQWEAMVEDLPLHDRGRRPDRAPPTPPEGTLAYYQFLARRRNDDLKAAFRRWQADLQRVPQVTSLPDPTLTYARYIRNVETRVGAQQQSLTLRQTVPWLGKLAKKGDIAAVRAKASYHRAEALRCALDARVTDAYARLYVLGASVRITRQNLRLLRSLEQSVLARYRTADAKRSALIRLQVEIGKLDDRLTALQDMHRPVSAKLRALSGRDRSDGNELLPFPDDLTDPNASVPTDLAHVIDRNNPTLQARRKDLEALADRTELAELQGIPDVMLGLTWIDTNRSTGGRHPDGDGKDAWIARIGVNLPIWRDRIDAGIREARLRHLAGIGRYDQTHRDLLADAQQYAFEYRDAERKLELYRRVLLPKAREAVKVATSAFRGKEASFTDLIDAQRVLLDFQLSHEQARADRLRAWAKLEELTGGAIGSEREPASADDEEPPS